MQTTWVARAGHRGTHGTAHALHTHSLALSSLLSLVEPA